MNNDINLMLSLLLFKMVLKITLSIIRQGKGKYEDFKEKKTKINHESQNFAQGNTK